jgi:zinc D-Ala-D-Ala carboxypeptidase
MNLTENFTLEELTVSDSAVRLGLSNEPTPEVAENLLKLAVFLEQVRTLLGKPIHVNSAYRSPEVNAHVGGKPTSQHCKGQAADIKVQGMTPDEVTKAIIASDLPYDQVIREFNTWTHVSFAETPRKMALIIDKEGTRAYG